DINNALDGLIFTPTMDFSGVTSLVVVANDLGNSGLGGARTDTKTVSLTFNPVDDAPSNNVPAAAQQAIEDAPFFFNSTGGNLISTSDVDAGNSPVQTTLTVA